MFSGTLPVREAYVKAADNGEVTLALNSELRDAVNQENAAVSERDGQCNTTITRIAELRSSDKWSENQAKALSEIETVVQKQNTVVNEFIALQRTSFSQEIPNFAMQDAIVGWTLFAIVLLLGWWIIVLIRRRRIWVDDEVCTRCDVCVLNEPEFFKRDFSLNIVRINGKSFDVVKKNKDYDDFPDRLQKQVDLCEPEALRITRFVPRRIKRQDKKNKPKG